MSEVNEDEAATSSIREKVARAIAATEYDKDRWDEIGECQREGYRANADAAIKAMGVHASGLLDAALMKPRASDALLSAMVEAVLDAGEDLDLRDWKRDAGFDAAKAIFLAWPNAELKEEK